MTHCFVGIGSNDDPERHCQAMIAALRSRFGEIRVSQLCWSQAQGRKAADYLNGVVYFETTITPDALKSWCKQLEKQLGRTRGSVVCRADLDLLLLCERYPLPDEFPAVESYFQPLVDELLCVVADP